MERKSITDLVTNYLYEIFKTKSESEFIIENITLKGAKNNRTIQILINKKGNVAISDCVFITKQLSEYIDKDENFDEHFILEVSSPGEKRNKIIKEESSD
ncbi:hypothetical protein DRP43_05575 [candidate division TA06 bacterium]|uniref:Ribosome maturation factor RimP N-terminal domain-containing protein n=1 Tax=candidate division TA06 bacterium TaxID=2250710 RepID=A0A660SCH8_UNCT6|nr:MAG: hypothetical protein DRP43_05575 [candidate division TA06 bacterium]